MISRLDLRGRTFTSPELRAALPRAEFDIDAALGVVAPLCAEVRDRGAEALYELGERFDGVRPPRLAVPPDVLAQALADLDPA